MIGIAGMVAGRYGGVRNDIERLRMRRAGMGVDMGWLRWTIIRNLYNINVWIGG